MLRIKSAVCYFVYFIKSSRVVLENFHRQEHILAKVVKSVVGLSSRSFMTLVVMRLFCCTASLKKHSPESDWPLFDLQLMRKSKVSYNTDLCFDVIYFCCYCCWMWRKSLGIYFFSIMHLTFVACGKSNETYFFFIYFKCQ